jgi:hypothetical protein
MDTFGWVVAVVIVLVLVGWYLSYSAARLDRLHARVEGALSALDAQLVRRAEATLELAHSGALDPATSLILAGAASDCLEAADERHAGREALESDLTRALELALVPAALEQIRAGDEVERDALERVRAAAQRVQLARRFHNDAVTDVQRVRRKRVVRWARLAGHAELPQTVEFDDELPVLDLGD